MSAFPALLKREVAAYFNAPTAYVLMTIFLAIMGLGLFVAILQAFIFAFLTMIYIGMALEEAH